MRRNLLRALAMAAALCLLFSCALAEEFVGDAAENEIVGQLPGSPDAMLALNGSLYAFLWTDCYRLTDEGWEHRYLQGLNGSALGYDAAGDTLYVLTRVDGEWDPETGEYVETEDGFYHILSGAVDADGVIGELEELCGVTWTINEQEWPQIYGFRVMDEAAYVLLFDWSDNNSDW